MHISNRGVLRIGLIGCGRVAERYHAPALRGLSDARLIAIADPLPTRAELIAAGFPGCRVFDSAEALIGGAGVEAVIIATPPETHVALARQAVLAGLPTLVEKPLAGSMHDADELQALGQAAMDLITVGFNRRHWQGAINLRRALARQAAGPLFARVTMTSCLAAWSPISMTTDPLEDLGSHQVDLLRFVFNREVKSVSARLGAYDAHMQIQFARNAVAECQVAHAVVSSESLWVEDAFNRRYQIHASSDRFRPATGPVRYGLDFAGAVVRRMRGQNVSLLTSYSRQLHAFCEGVLRGHAAAPGLADGIAAVRTVEAARQSAAKGGAEIEVDA